MSHFRFHLAVFLALLAFSAIPAHADSFTSGGYYSGNQNNFTTGLITFTFNGVTEAAAAGNITGSSGIVNGKAVNFSQTFCVDLYDDIYLNSTYTATYTPTGIVKGVTVNNAGEIAWLVVNLGPSDTTTAQNEALQAAIWTVEYPGLFTFLPGSNNAAVDAAYSADLAALGNNLTPVNSVLWMTAVNANGSYAQAQVVLAVTPEPASLPLMGTGLCAIAAFVQRRRLRRN